MKFKNDDELIGVKILNGLKDVLFIIKNNFVLLYLENEVFIYGLKLNGNKVCYLVNYDELLVFVVVSFNDLVVLINVNNKVKVVNVLEIIKVFKVNKGVVLFVKSRINSFIK